MTLTLFGPVWFGLLGLLVLVGVMTHFLLRGRDLAAKKKGLLVLAVVDLASSASFHLAYLADPTLNELFPLWQNLPLHLCTIMSFLMIPAIMYDVRPLRTWLYFPGSLAGFLTWVSAQEFYYGQPLFHPKAGFFVAHGLNFIIPALMATLGMYRPTARDALKSVLYTVIAGFAILPITLVIRAVADPGANYMYVFGGDGAGILDVVYNLIPIPIIYTLPLLAAVTPILLGQWGMFRLYESVSARLARRPPTLPLAVGA